MDDDIIGPEAGRRTITHMEQNVHGCGDVKETDFAE